MKRMEEIAKGRTNLFSLAWKQCEPAKIDVPNANGIGTKRFKLNTREDFGDIPEFALSLIEEDKSGKAKGAVRETLLGYMGENGKFQITNGERRWLGAKWLDENKHITILLPCRREEKGYDPIDRNLDLLRTNNGKPLEMIEQAEAMKRLLDARMPEKEIAKRAGCSQTHVANCLALLNSAPEIQESVKTGEMSGTLAADLVLRVPNKEKQVEVLNKGREQAAQSTTSKPAGTAKKSKITAKHLPVETGKKAQAAKKKKSQVNGQKSESESKNGSDAVLKRFSDLLDAVSRSDCDEPARYDTLEFLLDYGSGRQNLTAATKFILGM